MKDEGAKKRTNQHRRVDDARPGCSYHENPQQAMARKYEDEIDERLNKAIKEAEASKARIHEITGQCSISSKEKDGDLCDHLVRAVLVDEDYSVLGGHLDAHLRKKIEDHEYVDFARLLPRDRVKSETDNRMEMISQNRQTYWVPYADCNNLSISSYHKWELAFRVFSNVYTSAHPGRAAELLQYHYLIYSASQNYIWDNVYTYDIDFRLHISNHPNRSWGTILQQAWSFRLKDRLTHFKSNANSGDRNQHGNGSNHGWKKLCTPFNQGFCHFGSSCKFEHRCALCGKFGHGAINCRHRSTSGRFQHHASSGGNQEHDHRGDRYHYYSNRDHKHQHNGRKDGKK